MTGSSFFAPGSNNKRLLVAFIVTVVFMVTEVTGGLLSGSLALLADAGHMLTDAAALFLALMAVYFARRKPNTRYTFGYLRLPTLVAFINAASLFFIVILITWEAISRFFTPQEVLAGPMLLIAVAGLLANLFAFWVLHRGVGEKNINIRAATLHILGDLLGSVGAIIAAVVIMMTGWMPVDPLLSILVSVLVLRSAWQLLKESFHELLEGAAQGVDTDALGKNLCLTIPEVSNVHHVHLWQLGEQQLMTLHVQASSPPKDHDDLLQRVQHYLLHHYKISHATVQIEYQPCEKSECDIHQTGVAGAHVHHH